MKRRGGKRKREGPRKNQRDRISVEAELPSWRGEKGGTGSGKKGHGLKVRLAEGRGTKGNVYFKGENACRQLMKR